MLIFLVAMVSMASAQTRKVFGVVTSSEDGAPIVGASVLVEGTTVGTITDANGNFEIMNLPASGKTLQISFVSMKTAKVEITSGKMSVVLYPDTEVLDEVVVTAQGLTRKEKSIGYSTQKVDGEKLTVARQTWVMPWPVKLPVRVSSESLVLHSIQVPLSCVVHQILPILPVANLFML